MDFFLNFVTHNLWVQQSTQKSFHTWFGEKFGCYPSQHSTGWNFVTILIVELWAQELFFFNGSFWLISDLDVWKIFSHVLFRENSIRVKNNGSLTRRHKSWSPIVSHDPKDLKSHTWFKENSFRAKKRRPWWFPVYVTSVWLRFELLVNETLIRVKKRRPWWSPGYVITAYRL